MFRLYLLIFSLLILSCRKGSESTGPSNPPVNSPARSYGGFANDEPTFAQKTSDGGFIIAGYTKSFGAGNSDILLIKTDGYGNIQWAKTYGTAGNEIAYSVQQTSDGGFIIVGDTGHDYSQNIGRDILLIKTNANGDIQWAKIYGRAGFDGAYSVQQTSDGGFIIAGYTSLDNYPSPSKIILLIKTDANGNVQWAKTYGGAGKEKDRYILQTSDDGFVIAGVISSIYNYDKELFLAKIDTNWNLQWFKTYEKFGTIYSDHDIFLQKTSEGGYISLFCERGLLIKADANGNVQWAGDYGTFDVCSIWQTNDGGFVIAVGGLGHPTTIIKTDANLNIQWAKTYTGIGALFAQQTNDNGFMITALELKENFTTDILLIRTDANGNVGNCPISNNTSVSVYNPTLNVVNRTITTNSISITPSNISLTTTNLNLTPQDKCSAQ